MSIGVKSFLVSIDMIHAIISGTMYILDTYKYTYIGTYTTKSRKSIIDTLDPSFQVKTLNLR